MQKLLKNKPVFVDIDSADSERKNNSAAFIKNFRANFNKNASGVEGGNFGLGTPIQSNQLLIEIPLPTSGINHCCGYREFEETNEGYYCNWNSESQFGMYRLNGDSLTCDILKVDSILNFSIDPKDYFTPDRMSLKVIYITDGEGNKVIFEKFLIMTDGANWQFWVNVEAAIATQGFNSTLFPYYKPVYPHFDKGDTIQYASRPPMFPATFTEVPYSPSDVGKENHLLKQSIQLSYRYIYTDGRTTALAPYSEPFYLKESGCNITNQGLTRCLKYKLYAGGPMVEKIQILRRTCNNDFVLYDTIDKFTTCDENAPDIIQGRYWTRVKPFDAYNYSEADNTIEYTYCGDKECTPIDNSGTGDTYFQTSLPIKSISQADAGDAILFANNLKFYNNFDCETLKNLKINVIPPGENNADGCTPKTVKISVYAYLREGVVDNQIIYHDGADAERFFGGMKYIGPGPNTAFNYNQLVNVNIVKSESIKFNLSLGSKDGFIGYLCGTPYYAISKQYAVDAGGVLTEIGVIDRANATQVAFVVSVIKGGGYFVQKFDFTVPAGNYLFRMSGHRSLVTDDFSKTSTYVMGIMNRGVIGNAKSQFTVQDVKKEIEIHACDGDVDLFPSVEFGFMCIFTPFTNLDDNWRFVDGYFTESQTSDIGMEICQYRPRLGQNSLKITGTYTDANGFFFAYSSRSRANQGEVVFSFFANCAYQDQRQHTNINQNGSSGYKPNQNITWADNNGGSIGEQNRFHLKGKIINCETGAGISGVGITLGSSRTFFSDGEGNYELIFHGGFAGFRTNNLFFNASGSCLFSSCDCSCTPTVFVDTHGTSCISGHPRNVSPNIDKEFKIISSNEAGLKGGGMYGVSIVGFDFAERATYANLIEYVNIPTFLETGVFAPSTLTWEALNLLRLPPHVKSVSFFISKNLNFKSYIQWVGDKIEFIDSTGTIVEDGSGVIRARITIQSLLDFNTENNFATTVGYQFVQGDSVRIYDDGAGTLFQPDPVTGFMDYQILGTNFNESVQGQISVATTDETTGTVTTTTTPVTETDGKSFIIPYDSRLLKLKDQCGFWIELIRPKDCVDIEQYGEISAKYPVDNGEIMFGITSGPLVAFDTFYQNRSIRITDCTGKAILHPFESSSITDFWGEGCNSFGRITVKDAEVKQYWDQTEVTKSDEFVNNGRVNGIGTFRGKTSSFAGQKRGGIVAMHVETGIMAFVCENDIFVTGYNQKYVQAQANTGFIVVNLDNIIGEPQPKVGITHGCSLEDRAAIIFEKELSFWFDRKNGVPIIFPYSQAQDIAQENKSYFINKSTYIINFNKGLAESDKLFNLIEITGGYDPKNNDYVLTFRPRNGMKTMPQYFVNNERETKIPIQETFVFNIDQKKWTDFKGYTAEFYGSLRSSVSGKEFIAFAAGQPYFHNSILPKAGITFNNFFGVQTETVVDVSISGLEEGAGDKVKTGQSITVKSNGPCFYIDRIITDKPKAFTYVPLSYFKRVNNVWYSTVLADMNTYPDPEHPVPSQLIDGRLMNGLYFRIRFVMNPQNLSDYFEFDNIALRVSGVEKSDK